MYCYLRKLYEILCQYLFDDIQGTMRDRDIGGWVIVIGAIVRIEDPCDVWPGRETIRLISDLLWPVSP